MTLQYKHFTISVFEPRRDEEKLNRFLRTVRVLDVNHELLSTTSPPHWCVTVQYMQGGPPDESGGKKPAKKMVDYRAILSDDDFVVFAMLREWRKQLAEQEDIPRYTIFTNEQLAEIARRRPMSKTALGEIEGIGKGRLEKYSDPVLEMVKKKSRTEDEAGEPSV